MDTHNTSVNQKEKGRKTHKKNKMDINKLQSKYNTDKFDLGYFDGIYKKLVPDYLDAKAVLEIGTKDGESILLWREIFNQATIYAADIRECKKILNKERIEHSVGNAYDVKFVNKFENNFFDLIIDDGPHKLPSFHFLIDHYIDKLKVGGSMVIEDIINLNWTKELCNKLNNVDGVIYTVINMGGKQKTQRLLNLWHKGLDVILITKQS